MKILGTALTVQFGQTNPLMFSMSPITGMWVFLQKVISLFTSPTDTAYKEIYPKLINTKSNDKYSVFNNDTVIKFIHYDLFESFLFWVIHVLDDH